TVHGVAPPGRRRNPGTGRPGEAGDWARGAPAVGDRWGPPRWIRGPSRSRVGDGPRSARAPANPAPPARKGGAATLSRLLPPRGRTAGGSAPGPLDPMGARRRRGSRRAGPGARGRPVAVADRRRRGGARDLRRRPRGGVRRRRGRDGERLGRRGSPVARRRRL